MPERSLTLRRRSSRRCRYGQDSATASASFCERIPWAGPSRDPQCSCDNPTLNDANSTPSPVTSAQSADIKQFTMAKKPKSDQQFAAVVAYYYRFEAPASDRKDVIGSDDLTQAARLAGRERPTRPTLTLNNAKNSGYLDSAERGKFRINAVGENLVAVTLPGNGGGDAGSDGNRRRTQRKKKTSKRKGRRAGE